MNCRILKNRKCVITQGYNNSHQGIDIVGEDNTLDFIIAHSDGKVIFIQDGYDNVKGSTGNSSYGNCIKIEHLNGYCTLYAHLDKGIISLNGKNIKKGQILGYMGNSGNAYGKHLHFEVWKDNVRVNPINYLDNELIITNELKYKVGDIVQINGVYVSSISDEKLIPNITKGKITKIIENAKNPYLLEDGKIGWINDNCVVEKPKNKYLINSSYTGNSIVDALNKINIDSSFKFRCKLAKINNINNYSGTIVQNIYMLNLLKNGKLKYN